MRRLKRLGATVAAGMGTIFLTVGYASAEPISLAAAGTALFLKLGPFVIQAPVTDGVLIQ